VNPMSSRSSANDSQSNDSQVNDSQVVARGVAAPTRPFYWSVRRELWEYRSLYIAPLAVAALFLFGFMISTIHLPEKMRAVAMLSPMQQQELISEPYDFAAMLIMGVAFLVAIFYSLDALHGERRDRSILFWKSLPVSDFTAVLSKAGIPLVVLPLLAFTVTVALQWMMLLLSSLVLLGNGGSVATLWRNLPLIQMWSMMLFHLIAVHSLYYAPIYGWLLLVSAWARRAPFLWASLPLIAIAVVERIAFNTWHFATLLQSRVVGGDSDAGNLTAPGSNMAHSPTLLDLGQFLASPGLWIGLIVAAAFLFAAVRLRRSQGPI